MYHDAQTSEVGALNISATIKNVVLIKQKVC